MLKKGGNLWIMGELLFFSRIKCWTALVINLETPLEECLVLAFEHASQILSQGSYNSILCLPAEHMLQEFSQLFLPQAMACSKTAVYLWRSTQLWFNVYKIDGIFWQSFSLVNCSPSSKVSTLKTADFDFHHLINLYMPCPSPFLHLFPFSSPPLPFISSLSLPLPFPSSLSFLFSFLFPFSFLSLSIPFSFFPESSCLG